MIRAFPPITHVVFLSEFPGQNPISGAENQILLLIENLARSGATVEMIAMIWSPGDYPLLQQYFDRLSAPGVKITVVRRRCRNGILRWLGILDAFNSLRRLLTTRQDSIVHLHLDLRFAVVAARLAGCRKVIVTVHNDERSYQQLAWRVWLSVCRRLVWRFVGITDHVTDYIREVAALPREQAVTITYGIETPRDGATGRAEFGLPADRFIVGFVGRLTEQKNLRMYIEAAAGLPDLYFVLVGDGPDRKALEMMLIEKHLSNVRILGAIPNAARIMPCFNLLCLPSIWEGLGLVLLEAMIRGVPVAGSRRGAIPQVLGNGLYGLLFEPTVEGIMTAIKQAAEARETLHETACAAKEYVAREFVMNVMISRTLDLYSECERVLTRL